MPAKHTCLAECMGYGRAFGCGRAWRALLYGTVAKDGNGITVAKARAAIWANVFRNIRSEFYASTGQDFVSGLKVMVRLSVAMHQVYGVSFVINAVNPDYTMGDLLRRRREMLERLKAEGIAERKQKFVLGTSQLCELP